jgi:hypothetical protein
MAEPASSSRGNMGWVVSAVGVVCRQTRVVLSTWTWRA